MKIIFLILSLFLLNQCAHSIHQVGATSFDNSKKKKGKIIQSKSEQFTVLGFVTNTNYVEKAYDELLLQCPGGDIDGVTTQFSTSLGFLSWTNKLLIKGVCKP
tara:strand:+ start:10 stop:318 length:309 start_codon:yes stop_codon:yes gene_type:complete